MGAIGTIVISNLSLDEARRATREAQSATAEAHREANAAELQIGVAKDTAMRQLRAYLSAEPDQAFPPMIDAARGVRIIITLRNRGQTPAYKVSYQGQAALIGYPFGGTFAPLGGPAETPTTIGPGGQTQMQLELKGPLQPKEIAGLDAGTIRGFARGEVHYIDAFDHPHFVKFKLYFWISGPEIISSLAEDGNDSD